MTMTVVKNKNFLLYISLYLFSLFFFTYVSIEILINLLVEIFNQTEVFLSNNNFTKSERTSMSKQ